MYLLEEFIDINILEISPICTKCWNKIKDIKDYESMDDTNKSDQIA